MLPSRLSEVVEEGAECGSEVREQAGERIGLSGFDRTKREDAGILQYAETVPMDREAAKLVSLRTRCSGNRIPSGLKMFQLFDPWFTKPR